MEGGRDPWRIAAEPIVNVFDEMRRVDSTDRPSFCAVSLSKSDKPRGVLLTVEDDGPGFSDVAHVWTLFATTAKRSDASVSGRFNLGEKQLIATAIEAEILTGAWRIEFSRGKRFNYRAEPRRGVRVSAVLPWRVAEIEAIREKLKALIPPAGLRLLIDGAEIASRAPKVRVTVTLPTVTLGEGVMRATQRKTGVEVFEPAAGADPVLMELGVPVCSLAEIGFPWSLNVAQKVPLPTSRDVVSPAYLTRTIGAVVEAAAMDGVKLLSEEHQGAGFLRDALEWVREPEALKVAVNHVYGDNAVRVSSDPVANAQAAAAGATLVSGRVFSAAVRDRLDRSGAMLVSSAVYSGSEGLRAAQQREERTGICGRCGQRLPK